MRLTAFADSPVSRRFHDDLVEEHIEDASFLYQQRRTMLAEIDEPWTRVVGAELRIEAHVDALVVAGQPASDRCVLRAANAAEPGALFVATCVLCRRQNAGRLGQLLARIGDEDAEGVAAVREALRVELPEQWTSFIESALTGTKPEWIAVFADAASHRRLPISRALLSAIDRRLASADVAGALGRMRCKEARPALRRCLAIANDDVRAAALLALFRLGDAEALVYGVDLARHELWAREVVGLGGGRLAVRTLLRSTQDNGADSATIEALGLLGDAAAIPTLQAELSNEELAPCAARSLHWITGAALFEESFVADDVDEAALTASELEAWKTRKEQPLRSDGRPFGEFVRALSCNPGRWQRWLDDHAGAFQPELRYRSGVPCTPTGAVDSLMASSTDGRLRRATGLEMEIRYGCDVAFDVTMPVAMQRCALARMRAWAEAHGDGFVPGRWTFGGIADEIA